MAWPEDSWLACGAWLRDGDDRAAECEAPGVVCEAPAAGEGGETGLVLERIAAALERQLE